MGERKPNNQLGIFDVRELENPIRRNEIRKFIADNKCAVFILDEKVKHHESIKQMEKRACFQYSGMAVTLNGIGMQKFKNTFHRSCSHVDQRMISFDDLQKIFSDNKAIQIFWNRIKMINEFQVKGMGQIIVREQIKVEAKKKNKVKTKSKIKAEV